MALPGLPAQSSSVPSSSERPLRRNSRFFPDADSPLLQFTDTTGRMVHGVLTNESYSGVAALVADATGLEVGQEAAVDYYGHPMPGVIRRVIEQAEGDWLVGIEWK